MWTLAQESFIRLTVLRLPQCRVAAAHNVSTAQVALRWVVQQGVVAVTASDKASYDQSDLAIFGFELTEAEMEALSVE